MKTYYGVTVAYSPDVLLETPNLVEALRYATAAAMHTGKAMGLHRMNHDPATRETAKGTLVVIHPTSYDFRQIDAGQVLVMKAIAHELVSNIDEVAPELTKEGFIA